MIGNNRGQFVIESVLLIALMFFGFVAGVKILKEGQVFSLLVDGPWSKTASMIENGTWDANPAAGRTNHPNTGKRGRILNPKE